MMGLSGQGLQGSPSVKRRLRSSRADRVFRKPAVSTDPEVTGVVMGKKASDLEEYFFAGMRKQPQVEYMRFDLNYGGPPGTFGSVKLDYFISAMGNYAVQIDGNFVHKSSAARVHDYNQDLRLLGYLVREGISQIIRIPEKWVKNWKTAEQTAREVLMGRVIFDG